MFVDTHCHLDWESLEGELEGVLGRASNAGVGKLITIGTDLERNRSAKEVAKIFENVFRCVGYHPDVVVEEGFDVVRMEEWLRELERELGSEKVVGVGEIGLDYYTFERSKMQVSSSKDNGNLIDKWKGLQESLLRRQLELAVRFDLPISLHIRDVGEEAYWDNLKIMQEQKEKFGNLRGVMHCFSGPREYVMQMLELGFYVGVCGNITFNNAQDLRDILTDVPMERIVLETDAPFLAPMPFRGKRNESAFMVETAKKVGEIKGIALDYVEEITTGNAERLFGV